MKILSLTSENVKRLSVVEIKPDGNLVQITGKNGQGKTSVLDSIWWALAGAAHIQSVPIRKGAKEARIKLDLGEILVTRTFKQADGDAGATTKIVVETTEGYRATKPQQILDDLLGSLSFDPLAFTRMKPREQFDQLRSFVPGIDFDQVERDNKRDFDRRTDINRQAKQARAAAEVIAVPLNLPNGEIDVDQLVAQMEQAGNTNAELHLRAERRGQAVELMVRLREEADALIAEVPQLAAKHREKAAEAVADIECQIAALEAQIAGLRDRCAAMARKVDEDVAEIASYARCTAAAKHTEADALQAKVDAAGPLPEPVDTAALRRQIEEARAINASIARRTERASHLIRAEQLEAASRDLTDAIERRARAKEEAIAKAALPVPGISFGDGAILLNGLPFDQASDAEQLRASVAIAMASAPALRVIRVRDGSLLDEEGMRLLAAMADEHDCQVWVESVRSDGKVGFVLEDGHLASTPASRRAPQADLLGAA
jgi:DNA repair exonuclease SbcCD ATPase subunit